jgi:hypothetical protein
MMQAKGSAVIPVREFILQQYGQQGLDAYCKGLPQAAKDSFCDQLLASKWYPFKEALLDPLEHLCARFYDGDVRGAREEGKFAAGKALKGIYRAFIKVATPQFLLKNIAAIVGTYFTGLTAVVVENQPGAIVLRLQNVSPANAYFDQVVAGWIEHALEICGCQEIRLAVTNQTEPGSPFTQYNIVWK